MFYELFTIREPSRCRAWPMKLKWRKQSANADKETKGNTQAYQRSSNNRSRTRKWVKPHRGGWTTLMLSMSYPKIQLSFFFFKLVLFLTNHTHSLFLFFFLSFNYSVHRFLSPPFFLITFLPLCLSSMTIWFHHFPIRLSRFHNHKGSASFSRVTWYNSHRPNIIYTTYYCLYSYHYNISPTRNWEHFPLRLPLLPPATRWGLLLSLLYNKKKKRKKEARLLKFKGKS